MSFRFLCLIHYYIWSFMINLYKKSLAFSDNLLTFAVVIRNMELMVTEVNSKNQLTERTFKRNEMLADYFFGLSKIIASGVVIGGFSPLFTGDEMTATNYACVIFGGAAAGVFAFIANQLLKVELKKK